MTRYAVIEAPSVLGLFPSGVERLPEALLDAGLARALGARRAGGMIPPPYDPQRDVNTGLLNPEGLRAARRSGAMVGVEITIFNPALDPDGSIGRSLAACLIEGLA